MPKPLCEDNRDIDCEVPFAGGLADAAGRSGLRLSGWIGGAAPRGERGMLAVPLDPAMRLYSNPFYAFLEQSILEWGELRIENDGAPEFE